MMKRLPTLAAGIILSAALLASAQAAPNGDSVGARNGQSGKSGQIAGTPKSAKDWNDRDKKRRAYRNRAEETRKKNAGNAAGNHTP